MVNWRECVWRIKIRFLCVGRGCKKITTLFFLLDFYLMNIEIFAWRIIYFAMNKGVAYESRRNERDTATGD